MIAIAKMYYLHKTSSQLTYLSCGHLYIQFAMDHVLLSNKMDESIDLCQIENVQMN